MAHPSRVVVLGGTGHFGCFGSKFGGMHIRMSGADETGSAMAKTWFLTAHYNHGPQIPCSPASVLAKKLLGGGIAKRGAYPCMGLITLDELDAEVGDFDISWKIV